MANNKTESDSVDVLDSATWEWTECEAWSAGPCPCDESLAACFRDGAAVDAVCGSGTLENPDAAILSLDAKGAWGVLPQLPKHAARQRIVSLTTMALG